MTILYRVQKFNLDKELVSDVIYTSSYNYIYSVLGEDYNVDDVENDVYKANETLLLDEDFIYEIEEIDTDLQTFVEIV